MHFTKTKDMANIMLYKNRWESLLAGKKPRHRYHCIPCRHFIFSALGGHVINRSQYESTIPFTVTLFTVYILYKCTCIITILFISIILRGYIIIHMCCVIIYIILRYIVYYTNVVHALALLDCLVTSFISYAQVHLQTRSGCLYRSK